MTFYRIFVKVFNLALSAFMQITRRLHRVYSFIVNMHRKKNIRTTRKFMDFICHIRASL